MKHELTIPKAIAAANQIQPIKSILDHGCGKGGLITSINGDTSLIAKAYGYDPAIKDYSQLPDRSFDIVTSIDVLEHIGRGYIHQTIKEIKKLTSGFFFFCVDLVPAGKNCLTTETHTFCLPQRTGGLNRLKLILKSSQQSKSENCQIRATIQFTS